MWINSRWPLMVYYCLASSRPRASFLAPMWNLPLRNSAFCLSGLFCALCSKFQTSYPVQNPQSIMLPNFSKWDINSRNGLLTDDHIYKHCLQQVFTFCILDRQLWEQTFHDRHYKALSEETAYYFSKPSPANKGWREKLTIWERFLYILSVQEQYKKNEGREIDTTYKPTNH